MEYVTGSQTDRKPVDVVAVSLGIRLLAQVYGSNLGSVIPEALVDSGRTIPIRPFRNHRSRPHYTGTPFSTNTAI